MRCERKFMRHINNLPVRSILVRKHQLVRIERFELPKHYLVSVGQILVWKFKFLYSLQQPVRRHVNAMPIQPILVPGKQFL